MVEALLTTLCMENHHHPSTLLSMDSSLHSNLYSHDELEREMNQMDILSRPPDINLPLLAEPSPPPQLWADDACEILDVDLGPQIYEAETIINIPKIGRKCAKRLDSIWGAWFFFSFYFKPVLNEKSKCKQTQGSNFISVYDRSDLQLDAFMVQHDLENIYMWVFKERPDNALGKMQLRSYMNGHSRQGECPFPFTADKGFVRSHRMQRKHYRGLSNPQCVHGIEIIRSPNLTGLEEKQQKRWMDLTGRDVNFLVPLEASDFGSWRNLPITDFDLERVPPLKINNNSHPKRLLTGDVTDLSLISNKRKKDLFLHDYEDEFSGVMRNVYGPVTGAKTIYEDHEGYLIIVSLPFADLEKVKVTWRNSISHGIVKISCVSTACKPLIKRQNRTFKLTDPNPEHCPSGEFTREISLATRIPEGAKLEAYRDETGTVLEIYVPKCVGPEEHEVMVCLRPSSCFNSR